MAIIFSQNKSSFIGRLTLSILLIGMSTTFLQAQNIASHFPTFVLEQLQKQAGYMVWCCMQPALQQKINSQQLSEIFPQLEKQMGALTEKGEWQTHSKKELTQHLCLLRFERASLVFSLTTDSESKIAGLFFTPAPPEKLTTPDDTTYFTEREIQIEDGNIHLPGTLCLPKKQPQKVPIVVLVHGSGPNDRESTIGPNQPFRELAHRLAKEGIGSLRYDKRTFVYGSQTASKSNGKLNYDTETVDDAVQALHFAATLPETDTLLLFIIGHSQGGMLAPRIADRSQHKVAGVVCWAAPARTLDTLLKEQSHYIVQRQGGSAAQADSLVRHFIRQLPNDYLQSIRSYHPTKEAASCTSPMLFINGGHDYQVTFADYQLYQQALQHRSDVQFVWLPTCDHLLRELPQKATPQDYLQPGKMSEEAFRILLHFLQKF